MALKTALAAIAVAATVCVTGALPAHAQTLRWAAQNDILTLDPHSQNHATTNAILMHAYEGLTRYGTNREIEPALATKWTFISPTQVRFDLRKGVKFHDGTPFTADDVVFSFGRVKQPQGTMQIYVTGINEIKKIDDHTVDFMLAAPNPILEPPTIGLRPDVARLALAEAEAVTSPPQALATLDTVRGRALGAFADPLAVGGVTWLRAQARAGRLHEAGGQPEAAVAAYETALRWWGDSPLAEAAALRARVAALTDVVR